MRSILGTALVITAIAATSASAQQQAGGDASRKVAGGGERDPDAELRHIGSIMNRLTPNGSAQ